MKKLFCLLIAALPLLGGCSGSGSSATPPADLSATDGDGRVTLTWTAVPEVNYWLFSSTDPSLTAFVWTSLPNAYVSQNAVSPFYMCGLFDGTPYYFAANGRIGGGPGGSSTPMTPDTTAIPYHTGSTWSANTLATQSLYGVGYTGLTTCSNNTTSAAGSFAVVGASGVIATSTDGATWDVQTSPVITDLYAVTGYAANQNNPANPALRWVAVGASGVSVYSTDSPSGLVWAEANHATANPNNHTLHSLIQAAGTFFAVGDAGTILSSTDGITWTARNSDPTYNLHGITHGGIFVAVGDGGTILTSADGTTWAAATSGTAKILRQVSSVGIIYVAVGDDGTIVTSIDGGATWSAQTLPGTPAPDLAGIAAEYRYEASAVADTLLGFIPNAQFVAVDTNGKAYTSANGLTWSATAINTDIPKLSNLGQPLVSSGFGYVAAGYVPASGVMPASGVTATSF